MVIITKNGVLYLIIIKIIKIFTQKKGVGGIAAILDKIIFLLSFGPSLGLGK